MVNVYPVLHLTTAEAIADSLAAAKDEGFNEVFLIDMHRKDTTDATLYVEGATVARSLGMKVGVNILSGFMDFCRFNRAFWDDHVEAIWADNYREYSSASCAYGPYAFMPRFGGVAFKYQADPGQDLTDHILEALGNDVIVTTSGDRTGSPPSIEKVKLFRSILDSHARPFSHRHRLALASGITPQNLPLFASVGATDFLVGTALEKSDGVFCRRALSDLKEASVRL
jgi:hypothetical protein